MKKGPEPKRQANLFYGNEEKQAKKNGAQNAVVQPTQTGFLSSAEHTNRPGRPWSQGPILVIPLSCVRPLSRRCDFSSDTMLHQAGHDRKL